MVGLRHEKWQERPVAFVVARPGSDVDSEGLNEFLGPKVAKWWLPDRYEFIDELPKTGTSKFDKKVLRKEHQDLLL